MVLEVGREVLAVIEWVAWRSDCESKPMASNSSSYVASSSVQVDRILLRRYSRGGVPAGVSWSWPIGPIFFS